MSYLFLGVAAILGDQASALLFVAVKLAPPVG